MSGASDLIAESRIAIVRRDEDAYPGLLRRLEALHLSVRRDGMLRRDHEADRRLGRLTGTR